MDEGTITADEAAYTLAAFPSVGGKRHLLP